MKTLPQPGPAWHAPVPLEGRFWIGLIVSTGLAVGVGMNPSAYADNTVLDFGDVSGSALVPYSPALNPGQITVETWFLASSFYGAGSDPILDKPYYSHSYPYYQYILSIVGDQYPSSPRYAGFGLSVGGNIQGAGVTMPIRSGNGIT